MEVLLIGTLILICVIGYLVLELKKQKNQVTIYEREFKEIERLPDVGINLECFDADFWENSLNWLDELRCRRDARDYKKWPEAKFLIEMIEKEPIIAAFEKKIREVFRELNATAISFEETKGSVASRRRLAKATALANNRKVAETCLENFKVTFYDILFNLVKEIHRKDREKMQERYHSKMNDVKGTEDEFKQYRRMTFGENA